MSKSTDTTIFRNKSLASLMEDIYKNSMNKTSIIEDAIVELKNHIKNKEDVVYIGPIIADYMDVGIKNDEHLIKLASVVQRLIAAENKVGSDGSGLMLTDKERSQLLEETKSEMKDLEKRIAATNLPKIKK